jgi:hypothetical protein
MTTLREFINGESFLAEDIEALCKSLGFKFYIGWGAGRPDLMPRDSAESMRIALILHEAIKVYGLDFDISSLRCKGGSNV